MSTISRPDHAVRSLAHLDASLEPGTLDALRSTWRLLEQVAVDPTSRDRAVRARMFWSNMVACDVPGEDAAPAASIAA